MQGVSVGEQLFPLNVIDFGIGADLSIVCVMQFASSTLCKLNSL